MTKFLAQDPYNNSTWVHRHFVFLRVLGAAFVRRPQPDCRSPGVWTEGGTDAAYLMTLWRHEAEYTAGMLLVGSSEQEGGADESDQPEKEALAAYRAAMAELADRISTEYYHVKTTVDQEQHEDLPDMDFGASLDVCVSTLAARLASVFGERHVEELKAFFSKQ